MVVQNILLELEGNKILIEEFPNSLLPYISNRGTTKNGDIFRLVLVPHRSHSVYYNEEYENWFVDIIEKYHTHFKNIGITEIILFYNLLFSEQCNIEIFDRQKLKILAKYDVCIPLSCYEREDKELISYLLKSGYTKEEIDAQID